MNSFEVTFASISQTLLCRKIRKTAYPIFKCLKDVTYNFFLHLISHLKFFDYCETCVRAGILVKHSTSTGSDLIGKTSSMTSLMGEGLNGLVLYYFIEDIQFAEVKRISLEV